MPLIAPIAPNALRDHPIQHQCPNLPLRNIVRRLQRRIFNEKKKVPVHGFFHFTLKLLFCQSRKNSILSSLDAKDRRIAELETLLKAALEEIERLKARIAQLEQNSANSSKPPSSDIVKPPHPRKDKDRRKRKIGAQKGHKQNLRPPIAPELVDKIVKLELTHCHCPDCGQAFAEVCKGDVPDDSPASDTVGE
jgi:hypothetical protein